MGSGPHVLRGFQWYRGHLIAYSLGNFCGYNTLGLDEYTSVSAILHVTLNAKGQFVKGSITPLRLVAPGVPERDPDRTAVRYINSLSREDFGGNGAVRLSAEGTIEPSQAGRTAAGQGRGLVTQSDELAPSSCSRFIASTGVNRR